jgi:hypothetical protein
LSSASEGKHFLGPNIDYTAIVKTTVTTTYVFGTRKCIQYLAFWTMLIEFFPGPKIQEVMAQSKESVDIQMRIFLSDFPNTVVFISIR